MRFDRRLLGWGAFFILLGAIPLAVQQGYLSAEQVSRSWTLWPLLLIGWGLGLLLRGTPIDWLGGAVTALTFGVIGGSLITTGIVGVPWVAACGESAGPFQPQRGTLASSATVSVDLPCGELTIEPVNGTDWSLSGSYASRGAGPVVTTNDGGLQISAGKGATFGGTFRPAWDLKLPNGTEGLRLDLTLNASESHVNLDFLHLADVAVTVNAGALSVRAAGVATLAQFNGTINGSSATVSLPAGVTAEFTVNGGSLVLCVPIDTAVHIEAPSTFSSDNLDELGLDKICDDTWQSAGYEAAASKADLRVTTSGGGLNLAIGGGCGA